MFPQDNTRKNSRKSFLNIWTLKLLFFRQINAWVESISYSGFYDDEVYNKSASIRQGDLYNPLLKEMPIFDFMAPLIKLFICILSMKLRIAKKNGIIYINQPA